MRTNNAPLGAINSQKITTEKNERIVHFFFSMIKCQIASITFEILTFSEILKTWKGGWVSDFLRFQFQKWSHKNTDKLTFGSITRGYKFWRLFIHFSRKLIQFPFNNACTTLWFQLTMYQKLNPIIAGKKCHFIQKGDNFVICKNPCVSYNLKIVISDFQNLEYCLQAVCRSNC